MLMKQMRFGQRRCSSCFFSFGCILFVLCILCSFVFMCVYVFHFFGVSFFLFIWCIIFICCSFCFCFCFVCFVFCCCLVWCVFLYVFCFVVFYLLVTIKILPIRFLQQYRTLARWHQRAGILQWPLKPRHHVPCLCLACIYFRCFFICAKTLQTYMVCD